MKSRSMLASAGAVALIVVAFAAILAWRAVPHAGNPGTTAMPVAAPSAAPKTSAAMTAYRALVDRDHQALLARFLPRGYLVSCDDRQVLGCLADAVATRTAAQAFMRDLDSNQPPASLATLHSQLGAALRAYVVELNQDIAGMSQAQPALAAFDVQAGIGLVDSAVTAVDCWPAGAAASQTALETGQGTCL